MGYLLYGSAVVALVLVLWALRQPENPPPGWRKWLRRVPALYTVLGTTILLAGFAGQLFRDANLVLQWCFLVPLLLFGGAAVFHDALLRGRAWPRFRFGFTLLGGGRALFPAVDGGLLVRLKDEMKTEVPVARDRVRDLKEQLGI